MLTENRSLPLAVNEILHAARERGRQLGLAYGGALLPAEAYRVWTALPGATLIDIRTKAEWDWVGRIPGALEIEFLTYPGNQLSPSFLAQLEQQVERDALVMFICRSGGRSHHAAQLATQARYAECYNVLEGFEGDKDAQGHRNTRGGWRVAGLPWAQG